MDALTVILTRRSVRTYTKEPVSEENIQSMLQAAMSAPSAGNRQTWKFVVVDDPAMLEKASTLHRYAEPAKKAPLGILVCGDLKKEKYPGFWVQDCSAATQNLLLAAVALGLGAVWLGLYPVEDRIAEAQKMFALPEHIIPLGFVCIGHSKEQPRTADRYDDANVRRNHWS